MAPKLRRPVHWFTISIVEKRLGVFVATATCCFKHIKPHKVHASASTPRDALKKLRAPMHNAWGMG